MNEHLPGYRTSSARKGRGGPSLLTLVVLAVVLVAAGLALLQRMRPMPESTVAQTPTVTPTNTPPPTVTATATAVPEQHSSEWVVSLAPTNTPSPWPTFAPPATSTPRPEPSPTPSLSECVDFRWSSRQVFVPSAQVMVEIQAFNRCSSDIGPLDLWFEITGWRQGQWIQSVRGHPFDHIRRGSSEFITIGLPGSIDWYDEITVEIID